MVSVAARLQPRREARLRTSWMEASQPYFGCSVLTSATLDLVRMPARRAVGAASFGVAATEPYFSTSSARASWKSFLASKP